MRSIHTEGKKALSMYISFKAPFRYSIGVLFHVTKLPIQQYKGSITEDQLVRNQVNIDNNDREHYA